MAPNLDLSVVEAAAMADYEHYRGKIVLVSAVCGYVGNDSVDITLDSPAKVLIENTSDQSVKRWCDDWCDPLYEVMLFERHPQLTEVRSMWIYGLSRHLDGQRTEDSDIVAIVDDASENVAVRYCIDGIDQYGNYAGDGKFAPYVVFDIKAQRNVSRPFRFRWMARIWMLFHLNGKSLSTAVDQPAT